MEELQESLSLATFEADKAYEPYLNTPRSLEACRMNGINPIELVEIPIGEFQRDFPNDPDAVQRRFERVDGARRRILAKVKADWKALCTSGWKSSDAKPKKVKETIIPVSSAAHCQLLELQAEQFRRIEEENWNALNRKLKMEIKNADIEQKNKMIVQKHDEIQNSNDNLKKERQQMREALHHEELERLRKKQEDEQEEIRRLQNLDKQMAFEKKEADIQNKLREKRLNEKREFERVQRELYTKQLKNSIVAGIDTEIEAKKKMLEIQEKNTQNRLKQAKKEKDKEKALKLQRREERLTKAKEDAKRLEEEDRTILFEQIRKNEEHRRQLSENRERERLAMNHANENFSKEKLMKIKETNDNIVNTKASMTLQTLEMKDELARQELEKVRKAQEKRRVIKSIRQEAFKIASLRAEKQKEYRMMQITAELNYKEERSNAIKKGFFALNHMRNSMKDIMEKTNSELKEEMHRLKHTDSYSPDKVVKKAMEIGSKVLFPQLQKTFGIIDSKSTNNLNLQKGSDIFPNAFSSFPTEEIPSGISTNLTNKEGIFGIASTNIPVKSQGRKGFDALPIQTINKDRLRSALIDAKKRIIEDSEGVGNNAKEADYFFNDYADESVNGENINDPGAILKLGSSIGQLSLDLSEGGSNKNRSHTPSNHDKVSNMQSDHKISNKRGGTAGKTEIRNSSEDVKLPMFKFDPLQDPEQVEDNPISTINGSSKKEILPKQGLSPSNKKKLVSLPTPIRPASKSAEVRTDVNHKAFFLEPPAGKFRREFSLDHPLAKGGTGKYNKELKKGITPAGLDIPNAADKMSNKSVTETIETASKVEKLTYSAQKRVVDPKSNLDNLKKEQNEELKAIIREEREAEQAREDVLRTLSDPKERKNLESIFSEERKRASDRIIEATRKHEQMIKEAVLEMMELGGKNDNRLPVGKMFNE